jgi:hypothetical protein
MMAKADHVDQPWTDPIVEEVRSAREKLLAECDFDQEKLAAYLRERERAGGRQAVTLPPRAPSNGAA